MVREPLASLEVIGLGMLFSLQAFATGGVLNLVEIAA
jgi:hypothetical protein